MVWGANKGGTGLTLCIVPISRSVFVQLPRQLEQGRHNTSLQPRAGGWLVDWLGGWMHACMCACACACACGTHAHAAWGVGATISWMVAHPGELWHATLDGASGLAW